MSKQDLPCCDAIVDIHTDTWGGIVGRPRMYRSRNCRHKGRNAMHHDDAPGKTFHFCGTHARMARRGFIFANGSVMCEQSRAEYGRGLIKGDPSDAKHWHDGEAPAAPELTKAQLKLLKRSVKKDEVWGGFVKVSKKERAVGDELEELGLGCNHEMDDGSINFVAWKPGAYLARAATA